MDGWMDGWIPEYGTVCVWQSCLKLKIVSCKGFGLILGFWMISDKKH